MNLAVWAGRNGVARVSAYRWFRAGLLPVPAQREGRLILVNDAAAETSRRGRTAVYARVQHNLAGPGPFSGPMSCMPSGGSAAWRRNWQHGGSGYR